MAGQRNGHFTERIYSPSNEGRFDIKIFYFWGQYINEWSKGKSSIPTAFRFRGDSGAKIIQHFLFYFKLNICLNTVKWFQVSLFIVCTQSNGDELISDVLYWTPSHGRASIERPARTYVQQLCEDTGCGQEDMPKAMDDRDVWWGRVWEIHVRGTTWWWWWWCLLFIICTQLNGFKYYLAQSAGAVEYTDCTSG